MPTNQLPGTVSETHPACFLQVGHERQMVLLESVKTTNTCSKNV